MSNQNDRPIPTGPIDTEPRYSGEFPTSEDQRLILRGSLEVSDVELGDYDKRIISWAAEAWDWSTFATITSWIRRANEAGHARALAEQNGDG
jgi:hypothetical protein